jgi:hypothetical protein
MLSGQSVPLEVDTSAAFAYGLSDPEIWRSEFGGFLRGDYFDKNHSPLDGLEPYRPGQIPVIFIHGTASSSGRWANLVNDLQSDPVIREHFQFGGSPIARATQCPIRRCDCGRHLRMPFISWTLKAGTRR